MLRCRVCNLLLAQVQRRWFWIVIIFFSVSIGIHIPSQTDSHFLITIDFILAIPVLRRPGLLLSWRWQEGCLLAFIVVLNVHILVPDRSKPGLEVGATAISTASVAGCSGPARTIPLASDTIISPSEDAPTANLNNKTVVMLCEDNTNKNNCIRSVRRIKVQVTIV